MHLFCLHLFLFVCLVFPVSSASASDSPSKSAWNLDTFSFKSQRLKDNKLKLNLQRETYVWLPPSYQSANKSYPVIYYIHNYNWSAQQMHEVDHIADTFERAFSRGLSDEFIFVVADFRVPDHPGTFCGNNAVVGRWWDYIVEELVPAVDKRYRTLATPESRGLSGDYIGGYCAIRTAMERPGVFSSLYALHPVGTGIGGGNMLSVPNWELLNTAKSFAEINEADGFTRAFLLMAQSHVPNPAKPPFYADMMMELKDGNLEVNADTVTRLRQNFILTHRLPATVAALKQLQGFMFDWGRNDEVKAHVYGNRQFSEALSNYAIAHAAEEHEGQQWDQTWIPYGRVETRMLPFFQRYLARASQAGR